MFGNLPKSGRSVGIPGPLSNLHKARCLDIARTPSQRRNKECGDEMKRSRRRNVTMSCRIMSDVQNQTSSEVLCCFVVLCVPWRVRSCKVKPIREEARQRRTVTGHPRLATCPARSIGSHQSPSQTSIVLSGQTSPASSYHTALLSQIQPQRCSCCCIISNHCVLARSGQGRRHNTRW